MSRAPSPSTAVRTYRGYELWMVAQLSLGLLFMAGAVFLLPAFVLSLQGSNPGDVGVVMALLPLVGLAAPLVGNMLDRFGSYRAFQHLGLALFAVGFGLLAVVDDVVGAAVGALVLGTGAASLITTNLSLVAESGLEEAEMTKQMSYLQMVVPVGQVAGLAVLALLLELGFDFSSAFVVFAVLSVLSLWATAATNGPAVARTVQQRLAQRDATAAAPTEQGVDRAFDGSTSLGGVLLSGFGLLLLVVFLSVAAQASVESQYPNFMQNVFRIDGELAAAGLAVATLASLPVFRFVVAWLRSGGAKRSFLVGIAVRAGVGLALFLVADISDLPVVVPLAIYGLLAVVMPLLSISGPLLSAAASPLGPAIGQGAYGFALSAGAVAGAFVAGWAAESFGYQSLALFVAIFAGAAFVLGLGIPDERGADSRNGAPGADSQVRRGREAT